MGTRVVYGLEFSENGWPMVDEGSCNWVTVPGTSVTLEIQQGVPTQILGPFAADFNAFVETLEDPDSACWTSTNTVASSNHLSGTACDFNWLRHVMGNQYAGYSQAQIDTARELLEFYEMMVFWGNDWNSPHDSMHFQMGYNTYGPSNALRVQDFINRKIRADGFSTFRRGDAVDVAPILSQLMGGECTLDRYRQLLPGFQQFCQQADVTTVDRIAMAGAQLGEESIGLSAMEELASGSEYEGRLDLGNIRPGDGVRFKGRGPIQVTGRDHYTALSAWAFGKGYVPTATFFVDDPAQLSSDQYGFIGAAWYWTVERPQINSLCDAQDILGVTKAINGGTNGLADRTARYNKALAMGNDLLALVNTQGDEDEMAGWTADLVARAMLLLENQDGVFRKSMSPLRHWGEAEVNTDAGFAQTADGLTHPQFVLMAARFGHIDSIDLIAEVANGDLTVEPDRAEDKKLAAAMLQDLQDNYPEALEEYLASKGSS